MFPPSKVSLGSILTCQLNNRGPGGLNSTTHLISTAKAVQTKLGFLPRNMLRPCAISVRMRFRIAHFPFYNRPACVAEGLFFARATATDALSCAERLRVFLFALSSPVHTLLHSYNFGLISSRLLSRCSKSKVYRQIHRYLIFYVQATAKDHISIPTASTHSDSLIKTHFTVEDLEKMKLNEPERQTLSRYRSHVSRHSIQSHILTYYRLRKREPLIALGSQLGCL